MMAGILSRKFIKIAHIDPGSPFQAQGLFTGRIRIQSLARVGLVWMTTNACFYLFDNIVLISNPIWRSTEF